MWSATLWSRRCSTPFEASTDELACRYYFSGMSNTGKSSYRITRKGQVTVPKAIRDHLGVREGEAVVFEILEDGQVRLRKSASGSQFMEAAEKLRGTLIMNGLTTDELMKQIRDHEPDPNLSSDAA